MPSTACTNRANAPTTAAAAAVAAKVESPPLARAGATLANEPKASLSSMGAVVAIRAETLTRTFGDRVAVDAVSFDVQPGEIFGFLDPNGAGKSTTARMLTGFIQPTSGRALVNEIDVARHPAAARRHIGVVPEEANVYADLSVWDNVMLMAEFRLSSG